MKRLWKLISTLAAPCLVFKLTPAILLNTPGSNVKITPSTMPSLSALRAQLRLFVTWLSALERVAMMRGA